MEDPEWLFPVVEGSDLRNDSLGTLCVSLEGSVVLWHGLAVHNSFNF
jgi:hypothetical protein